MLPGVAKRGGRAFAVKVDTKRLPVFLYSGVDMYHDFRDDAFCDLYNLSKVWKIYALLALRSGPSSDFIFLVSKFFVTLQITRKKLHYPMPHYYLYP
jgi:hypothetical protein